VNAPDLVQYRLRLAEGFLKEAEQDFGLERWRSCVDNAQLATGERLPGLIQRAVISWDCLNPTVNR